MTNKKISALPSATTPLAGTEVLPIVQGGVTDQVTVSDLTAGRAVSMASATLSSGNLSFNGTGQKISGDFSSATLTNRTVIQSSTINGNTGVFVLPNGTSFNASLQIGNASDISNTSVLVIGSTSTETSLKSGVHGTGTSLPLNFYTSNVKQLEINTAGNITINTGNLVQGTAAKGINFTANTPAAGITSQLLNWYEEGTWTPNQGTGLTVVGAFSSNGTYVRIGRSVTVKGQVLGAITVAVAAAGVISSNLPFTAASGHAGSMHNAAIAAGGTIAITSTSATAASAITATPSITFTATYQV